MDPKDLAEMIAAALGMEPTDVIMFDEAGDVIEAQQERGELPRNTHSAPLKLQ